MIARLEKAINAIIAILKAFCPYDTGNLASTIRAVNEGEKLYILIGGEVADYASLTNEPWTHGKNPNEGWVQKAIAAALPIVKSIMGGTISDAEYDEFIATQESVLAATRKRRIEEIKQ